jgi:TonB family protein
MKKFCYFLSVAGHALLILIALSVDFPIVMAPAPPRVIAVEIAAPPPPFFASGPAPGSPGPVRAQGAATGGAGGKNGATAAAGLSRATVGSSAPALPFTVPATLSLKETPADMFTLAPANRAQALALPPIGPGGSLKMGKYSAATYRPGMGMAGATAPSGVFLIPFDIKERTVAAWTEAVLARIERNWTIPAQARLAFAGQVRITLTIEKNGEPRALAVADSSLPEAMSQAALQAVKASLPLPRLPENVAGQEFAFTFVFIYNG